MTPQRIHKRIPKWTWAHRSTAALFLLFLFLGRFEVFALLKGSTTSTRLFDILRLADPLAALEVILASRQLHAPLLVAAGLIILFYALVGRAFCGWVCPLGLLLELNHTVRQRVQRSLRRRKRRLPDLALPRQTKYGLLALALGLSFATQLPVFQLVSPINLLSRSIVFAPEAGLVIVGVIILVEYVSPRTWCHALCPLGAFYSLIGRWGRVRVLIDQERERQERPCGLCTYACPINIRVLEDHVRKGKTTVDDPECMRCGLCIDGCSRGNLRLGVSLPAARREIAETLTPNRT